MSSCFLSSVLLESVTKSLLLSPKLDCKYRLSSFCFVQLHRMLSRKMPAEEISPVLKFAKLSDKATTPTRGSENAAGYDLYSAADCVVPAKGKFLVPTDIQIAVPDGCYGRVAPRSGLAIKNFIDLGAGVVDHDYRGNVGVVMFNFSEQDFQVKTGDRIAQLICERIFCPDLQELPTLSSTKRGDKGFGSTGIN